MLVQRSCCRHGLYQQQLAAARRAGFAERKVLGLHLHTHGLRALPTRYLPCACLQGVVFAEEEAADPELLDVLPPWDPAELEQEVSVEGSAGDEGRQEEDANEVGWWWVGACVAGLGGRMAGVR